MHANVRHIPKSKFQLKCDNKKVTFAFAIETENEITDKCCKMKTKHVCKKYKKNRVAFSQSRSFHMHASGDQFQAIEM